MKQLLLHPTQPTAPVRPNGPGTTYLLPKLALSHAVTRLLVFVSGTLLLGGLLTGCQDHGMPPKTGVVTLATGLLAPIGMETDAAGRVWVAEAGTAKNDGRVSIIGADGKINPVITGFDSKLFQGDVNGLSHLLFADGVLYIFHANGKLYKASVASFKIGDPPLLAQNIPFEDVGTFVRAQTVANNPANESHPYQAAIGPTGDMFIADAGANVIVQRNKTTGALSIFTNIPGFANPTPVGPPFVQAVPTGVAFNGFDMLVSTLTGFPFLAGRATVYQVSPAGTPSVYQQGFNPLTGLNYDNGLVVLEYGTFSPMGWVANTGRLLRANKPGTTVLTSGLNRPTALKKITANSYYVLSLGDNALLKVTF